MTQQLNDIVHVNERAQKSKETKTAITASWPKKTASVPLEKPHSKERKTDN